jgi:hypothetical protein
MKDRVDQLVLGWSNESQRNRIVAAFKAKGWHKSLMDIFHSISVRGSSSTRLNWDGMHNLPKGHEYKPLPTVVL